MRVVFYQPTESFYKIDCSGIEKGNPGIGGSEYEFLLVPYLLEKRTDDIEPFLVTTLPIHSPHKNKKAIGNGINSLCDYCSEYNVDVVVINQVLFNENNKSVFDKYSFNFVLVLWDHNGMSMRKLSLVSSTAYIKRIVCCGKEMLDMYRDHIAQSKSSYVYNIFPINTIDWYKKRIVKDDNHNVIYMGSIIPVKGFHILARSWKSILDKVPDAQLYIIGSGRLYDKNASIGKYGIADSCYESQFMPFLLDNDGKILSNVHFMGLMGENKFNLLGKCKVGVPNPSGNSECLPITTLEMQLMGCNITTIRHPAYLDTIYNHRFLYTRCKQLSDFVVKRLLFQRDDYDEVYNFISHKFDPSTSLDRWVSILLNVRDNLYLEPCSSLRYQMKPLKNILLILKLHIPFLKIIPLVRCFYSFIEKKILKRKS